MRASSEQDREKSHKGKHVDDEEKQVTFDLEKNPVAFVKQELDVPGENLC